MKLKTLLIFSCLTCNAFLNAQTDTLNQNNPNASKKPEKPKNTIKDKYNYKKTTAINALYAMPLGHFAKKGNDGGYAMPGWGVSFDTRSHLGYGFSFVSYSSYSWINLDSKAMEQKLTEDLGLNTTVIGGQHRPFFTTVGLSKHFYLTPRLQMGLSATAGVLYTSFKSFEIIIKDQNNITVYDDVLRFDSDFAFAYGFSTDFNLFIIKNVLALHFEVKYNTAKTDSYLRSNYFSPIKSYEKMEFLNFNMGFNFYTK